KRSRRRGRERRRAAWSSWRGRLTDAETASAMGVPRWTIVVAALALAGCRTREPLPTLVALTPDAAPVETAAQPTPRAIPTSWSAGVPIVEATLDGRGPLHVLLDSGTSMPILHKRVADAWKLPIVE